MKLKLNLSTEFKILERINNETNEDLVEQLKNRYNISFVPISNKYIKSYFGNYTDSSYRKLQKIMSDFVDLKNILDEHINLESMRTNFKLSIKTELLTIINIILALLTLLLTFFGIQGADLHSKLKTILKIINLS